MKTHGLYTDPKATNKWADGGKNVINLITPRGKILMSVAKTVKPKKGEKPFVLTDFGAKKGEEAVKRFNTLTGAKVVAVTTSNRRIRETAAKKVGTTTDTVKTVSTAKVKTGNGIGNKSGLNANHLIPVGAGSLVP